MLSVRINNGAHMNSSPAYPKTHLALLLLGPSSQRGRVNQPNGERVRDACELRHSWSPNILGGVILGALLVDLGSAVPRMRCDSDDASRDGRNELDVSLLLGGKVVQ